MAIAEMSFWHLLWLSPGVKLPAITDAGTPYGFNAATRTEDRETYAQQIEKMVADKKLPPTPAHRRWDVDREVIGVT